MGFRLMQNGGDGGGEVGLVTIEGRFDNVIGRLTRTTEEEVGDIVTSNLKFI